jgi:hypothetical protein
VQIEHAVERQLHGRMIVVGLAHAR